jgi:hypothetical protein
MQKNKTLIIAIILIVLVLLGLGAYLTLSKSAKNNQQAQNPNMASPTSQKPENTTKSFMDLLTSGVSQQCTFDVKTTASQNSGTFYIATGKFRGNITTIINGKTQDISIIRDGDTNYIWGSALPQGIKMTLAQKDFASDNRTGQFLNPNAKMDYKCSPWVTDASVFTVPTNIKFMEIPTNMLPTPQTSAKPGSTMAPQTNTTSPCDAITEATAKAACLKALSGQQ